MADARLGSTLHAHARHATVLTEIENYLSRNKMDEDLKTVLSPKLVQYLPLAGNKGSKLADIERERKKDHYGHFVLRLAFSRSYVEFLCLPVVYSTELCSNSEELRARFLKAEMHLFKLRFEMDQADERSRFIKSLEFDWIIVRIYTHLDRIYAEIVLVG